MPSKARTVATGSVLVAFVLASAAWFVTTHLVQADSSPTCRQALEPTNATTLPSNVLHDLGNDGSPVSLDDLTTPTVDDTKEVQTLGRTLGYPGHGGMVCAWKQPGQVMLLQSVEKRIEPCYGSADQCKGQPTTLHTCLYALDLKSQRWISPQGCLP